MDCLIKEIEASGFATIPVTVAELSTTAQLLGGKAIPPGTDTTTAALYLQLLTMRKLKGER